MNCRFFIEIRKMNGLLKFSDHFTKITGLGEDLISTQELLNGSVLDPSFVSIVIKTE